MVRWMNGEIKYLFGESLHTEAPGLPPPMHRQNGKMYSAYAVYTGTGFQLDQLLHGGFYNDSSSSDGLFLGLSAQDLQFLVDNDVETMQRQPYSTATSPTNVAQTSQFQSSLSYQARGSYGSFATSKEVSPQGGCGGFGFDASASTFLDRNQNKYRGFSYV
eukprot:g2658.t1